MKTDKDIGILDIEEIQQKSEMITGISAILILFLDYTKEDNQLKGAIKCLEEVARSMLGKCNSLLNEFTNS